MANTRTEANRMVIRTAFEGCRDGIASITDVFAPDMVWRIEGHSLASKQYRNKQQFIDGTCSLRGQIHPSDEPVDGLSAPCYRRARRLV